MQFSKFSFTNNKKTYLLILIIILFSGILGNHIHETYTNQPFSIETAKPNRTVVANLFTVGYDLNDLALEPGEVIDIVLINSLGTDHSFVLSNPFNSIYQYKNNYGEIVLRILATTEGLDNVICELPGHEGLHANFIIAN